MLECGDEGVSPTRRESAYDMIQVEAAVELVLQQLQPLEAVKVQAHEADGFVLAEPVHSIEPLPPFRASIMDGYAVIAADGTGTFPVMERIAAGDMPASALKSGQVSYITTGSPVPDGADAVVKIEDTSSVGDSEKLEKETAVNILKGVKAGQNIRPIGSDISPGEVLVDAHELVTAAELGLLATTGITEVIAHRKPVVGVLSTGSELVEAFQGTTTPGKIRDSNRPMLLALLNGWGATTLNLGVCSDKKQALQDTILKALEKVDVLITSGGVSMGEHDLIKPLLEEVGTVHFGRLLMKPGKPTTFATLIVQNKRKLVFALPGNPVSSFTTCHLLVHPALKRLRGLPISKCYHTKVYAALTHPIKLDAERPEFHRANLEWDGNQHKFLATSTGRQISSRLLSCRNANALLCLPTGTEIRDGDAVAALVLDSTFGNTTGVIPTMSLKNQGTTVSNELPAKEKASVPKTVFRAGLLTISDRVSAGASTDMSGPAMVDVLQQVDKVQINVVAIKVVPDDVDQIQTVVMEWADSDAVDLILTSGGTGFSPRDVTPEAIKAVLEKEIPGFPIAMLESSLKITAKAVLSRPVAGIRKRTLIVTLPGKPKAVVENFSAIAEVLPHALHLVRDVPHEHHRANPSSLYT
ncbi:Molybdopterin biosynthesis protein CNX1 [Phytophthora citrophthora]|uniref:Molybdopterin biosynthesis protein CNX1 n=1 Tax=Phytophthora citrophthora TaxID=4793 RepID=A0AAD9LCQ9_9STRA|nr:Molybdopterin biosynthesis protein CNX1 [Phytophthora citrophthora]